ncbi:unnamed protein product [Fasciola hepatica]|uniref:Uncharacterized protein n=1 Tax=Fasciola hepatica TaxID=6192 RepID=A0ABC9HIB1_FASHE
MEYLAFEGLSKVNREGNVPAQTDHRLDCVAQIEKWNNRQTSDVNELITFREVIHSSLREGDLPLKRFTCGRGGSKKQLSIETLSRIGLGHIAEKSSLLKDISWSLCEETYTG